MAGLTLSRLAQSAEFQALCNHSLREEAIKVLKDAGSTAAQKALAKAAFAGLISPLGVATWFLCEQASTGSWPANRVRTQALRSDPAPPEITSELEQRVEQFPGIYLRPQAELVCALFGVAYA